MIVCNIIIVDAKFEPHSMECMYYVCTVIDSETYLECVANGHYIIK